MVTDPELLASYRDGDKQAGDVLYRRHFVGLRTYFLSRAPEAYEELIHETFVRLFEHPDRYRGESSFKSFLFGIARRVYLEYVRERVRQGFSPERDSIADASGRRYSSILAEREELRLLLDALRAITAEKQDLLELHYFQELTLPEIAPILEVGANTLKRRLQLARKDLLARYLDLANQPHDQEITEADIETWLQSVRDVARRGQRRDESS